MDEKNQNNDMFAPVEGRFCTVCGNPLNMLDIQEDLTIQRRLGYGSLHDEEEVRVEFCCECFDKLLDSFKLPTLVKDWGE